MVEIFQNVSEFFPFNSGARNELILENDVYSDVFPKGLVSIGPTDSCDRICLRLGGGDESGVYVYHTDTVKGFRWDDDMVKVADSFGELAGMFRELGASEVPELPEVEMYISDRLRRLIDSPSGTDSNDGPSPRP